MCGGVVRKGGAPVAWGVAGGSAGVVAGNPAKCVRRRANRPETRQSACGWERNSRTLSECWRRGTHFAGLPAGKARTLHDCRLRGRFGRALRAITGAQTICGVGRPRRLLNACRTSNGCPLRPSYPAALLFSFDPLYLCDNDAALDGYVRGRVRLARWEGSIGWAAAVLALALVWPLGMMCRMLVSGHARTAPTILPTRPPASRRGRWPAPCAASPRSPRAPPRPARGPASPPRP